MTDDLMPLVDDWPFPLFQLDDADCLVWANQVAQEWLGQSLRRLSGKHIWDIFETEPDTTSIASKARAAGGTITSRKILIKAKGADGDGHLADISAYTIAGGMGLSIWFLGSEPKSTKIGGQLVTGMGLSLIHI